MAIINRKLSTYAKDVKALSDTPNDDGLTSAQLKAVFMGAADEEIKTNHNGLIDDLVSKVDGSSGADNIGATAVKVGGSETVQGILEELKTEKVDAVVGKGLSTNDYDNTEKANVASNTSARHTHSNKALLDTYTQTEANLADAVTKKHAHANLTALNNVSGVNTGDQDLSGYALKTNVLEKTNTTAFTPTADHHPATKKYVDDTTPDVPYLSTINGVVTAIVDDDTKLPTSGAVVDYIAGLGGGDMLKATYDPTNKSADAFAMANMVEGTTNKIFTATERTKLSGIAESATASPNKNLLHNWDFRNPVNQRGQSSYIGAAYGIDRWKGGGGFNKITINSGYITVEANGGVTQGITQIIEQPQQYVGLTVTFSVNIKAYVGTIRVRFVDGITVIGSTTISNVGITSVTLTIPSILTNLQVKIETVNAGDSFECYSAKLELGSVSTLDNDPPADFGEQLALCQRYFIKYELPLAYHPFAQGVVSTSTASVFLLTLPSNMRVIPTYSLSGTFYIWDGVSSDELTSLSISKLSKNILQLTALRTTTNVPISNPVFLRTGGTTNPDAYISFSADL